MHVTEAHGGSPAQPLKDSKVCSVGVECVLIGTANFSDSALSMLWELKY
jgi:hypothetical protein